MISVRLRVQMNLQVDAHEDDDLVQSLYSLESYPYRCEERGIVSRS
jgi:hypothetical protein